MSAPTEEIGALPLAADQYGIVITAATTIVVPTTAQRAKHGGELTLVVSVEGQNARVTWSGTAPTTTNGILFNIGTYTFRGEPLIKAMKWISVVAAGTISYGFYVGGR